MREDGTRPRLCVGRVYLTEETLFVRNPNFGYVTVSNEYPLGADYLGRDLLSRLMYGARISLVAAMIGSTVSLIVGVAFGLTSGFLRGRADSVMMRMVDVMYFLPDHPAGNCPDGLLPLGFRKRQYGRLPASRPERDGYDH